MDADDGNELAALPAYRLARLAGHERHLPRGSGHRPRRHQRHLR